MDQETARELELELRPRKIYRSKTDRLLFGVCGGIAEYYNIESLWVRTVFIFLGVTGAVGFILYLALAVLMPLNPEGGEPASGTEPSAARQTAAEVKRNASLLAAELRDDPKIERRRNLLGLLIVAIGVIAFLNELFPNFWIGWKVLWPAIIIFIGLSFISDARPSK